MKTIKVFGFQQTAPNQFIENKISNPTIDWAKTNLTNGDVK